MEDTKLDPAQYNPTEARMHREAGQLGAHRRQISRAQCPQLSEQPCRMTDGRFRRSLKPTECVRCRSPGHQIEHS